MKAEFNAWEMHKKQTQTQKTKEKNILLKLARQGSKLAVEELKKNYGIKFTQETA